METTTEDWKDDNSHLAPLLNNGEQVSNVTNVGSEYL